METSPEVIAGLIQKVMEELTATSHAKTGGENGLYATVNDAVEAGLAAQKKLLAMSLERRKDIIASIRNSVLNRNEEVSAMAVEETKLGRYEDKVRENILCATKTPGVEDIEPRARSGDNGLMLLEYAPVGMIGALTPITNPTGTLINNSIGMISAGNAVIFNAHPSATRTSSTMLQIIHQAIVDAGGPAGLVSSVAHPTLETAKEVIEHPKINMLVATEAGRL